MVRQDKEPELIDISTDEDKVHYICFFCLPRYIRNIPVYAFNGIQNSKSYYFFRKNVMTGEVVTVLDR